MRALLLAILCSTVFAPLALHAGQKKPPPVTIRLHAQGQEQEGPSFVTSIDLTRPQKRVFIRIVPEVSEKDIKAFLPFPGNDGMAGAYFQLDAHGTNKLLNFSTEAQGTIGVILVNGRVASAVRVEIVRNGILYVPGGILPNEIAQLSERYPVIGKESEFGKKPKKEKAPKAEAAAPAP